MKLALDPFLTEHAMRYATNILCASVLASLATSNCLAQTTDRLSGNNYLRPRSVTRDGTRGFQKRVLSWQELKTQNVVMQQRDYSCGAAAVATVLRYHWGENVGEADLLAVLALSLRSEALRDRTENGLSMADLKVVSERLGYSAAVGTLKSVDELSESKVPVVVSLKLDQQDHFVAVRGVVGNHVFIADPLRGNDRMSAHHFERAWNERAVFVVTPEGKNSSEVSRLEIRNDEFGFRPMNDQIIRRQLVRPNPPAGGLGF